MLAFVVPYAIVLGAYEGTLLRFLLPFIPLAACAGGWAVECARALAARARDARARLCAGSGALAVALPLWRGALRLMRTQPTPMDQAARWIEEHVDPSETIAVLPYRDLPLAYAPAAARANAEVEHRSQWSEWQLAHPDALGGARAGKVLVEPGGRPDSRLAFEHDALAYLRGFGVRWVVLDLSGGGQDVLAKIATRAARFAPSREDDGRERGLTLVGTGFDPLRPSAARILRMQSLGTTVEIWRLP